MNKRDKEERINMVVAMDYIVNHLRDRDYIDTWHLCGVAEDDCRATSIEKLINQDWYLDDTNFSELMGLFLTLMYRAHNAYGLQCGKIVSD